MDIKDTSPFDEDFSSIYSIEERGNAEEELSQEGWEFPLEEEIGYLEEEEPIYEEKDSSDVTPETILKKYWGYSSFREKQRDIIDAVLAGHDTLGLLPTGGGKSITFQVPGMMLKGTTLVITPLIALMKDQVQGLKKRGIKAAALHSGIPSNQIRTLLNNTVFGKVKFLYISPERISSPGFSSTLNYLNVSLIVVDECHCISQWGYDFRPSYLQIATLREIFPKVPILALTATATPLVKEDVIRELKLRDPKVIQKSFARSNLTYAVRHCIDKEEMIAKILEAVPGSSIIYCRNRVLTAEIAESLKERGFTADSYHAGLSHAERDEKQKAWMNNEVRVIVATNAFGMGIDKPDVRTVIHWTMPSSLEEYYQEAGRAGRDGLPSYAVALAGPRDKSIIKRRVAEQFPSLSFIRSFYDLLMSYLQIGESDGLGRCVQLDMETFLETFKLSPIQGISALNILEMAGAFVYTEKSSSSSRIMMAMPRDALYNIKSIKGKNEEILEFLLRRYAGIFTQFIYIEEEAIAIATQTTLDAVYESLIDLARLKVLRYIPRSSLPLLTLTTKREPGRLLNITPEVYDLRKERFQQRIKSVLNYLYNPQNECREKLLLCYFGELNSPSCGHCDICIEKKKKEDEKKLPKAKRAEGKKLLVQLLAEQSQYDLHQLIELLATKGKEQRRSREEWIEILQDFVASTTQYRIEDNKIISRR